MVQCYIVHQLNEDGSCDLCNSKENVDRQLREVGPIGCVKTLFTHVVSNLCQNCKSQGWSLLLIDNDGMISYYNHATNELKRIHIF